MCCTSWPPLTVNCKSTAITAPGCPPAHTHVPAALTLGVVILPLGRSLCMPAKQRTENENTLNTAFTSNTQTPPPSSRHSFNRMLKAQKRRTFLAQDGFSRGCSVRKCYVAWREVDSLGGLGRSLKALIPSLRLSISTIKFAPTSVLH